MATAQAIIAVIRAASPTFKNKHDRLAFAVHAAVLANGYRLVAVGDQADRANELPPTAPDAPITGWDSASGEEYSFAYLPDVPPAGTGASMPLLVKCLVLGDVMVVSLAIAGQTEPPPEVLELDTGRYVTDDTTSVAKSYNHLDELAMRINAALQTLVTGDRAAGAAQLAGDAKERGKEARGEKGVIGSPGDEGGAGQKPRGRVPDPDLEPLSGVPAGPPFPQHRPVPDPDLEPLGGMIGPHIPFPEEGPVRHPMRPGEEDIMRPGGGFGPPEFLREGPPMMPGGDPRFPGPSGGGMVVGPDHPYFTDRMRDPRVLPGRGSAGVPGGRWDPIAPEGMRGWSPDDFARGGPGGGEAPGMPRLHPDVEQPPPGKGTDWDAMFG